MTETARSEPEVLSERRGHLGIITLNRPRVVNAVNHAMVQAIAAQLNRWLLDDEVAQVLVRGAGERGLCAGGDIVALYRDMLATDGVESADFWRDEYRLNALIARYPKPYIALMDGLTLGGGVGLSAHGSHRIVTERTRMGMPETGIGFVPDVGGTHLLSRAPGRLGEYAALTGAHLDGADALALGLADILVPTESLDALQAALETEPVDDVLPRFVVPAPEAALRAAQPHIDEDFAADTVAEILARLDARGADAAETAAVIRTKSPTALAVALAAVRAAREMDTLEDALRQEFRIGVRSLRGPDFREGIRAQVIDKDRTPAWTPASLEGVSAETVAAFLAPLGDEELGLIAPRPIAFLGLGHMGLPMALNLQRAGYTVMGFDPVPAAADAAAAGGLALAASAASAVAEAGVVITMLPSGAHLLAAYRGQDGADGLLATAAPGTIFLDCSTISVAESREAAALATAAGHRALDAPVSGGVVGAEAGTLTFMVGAATRQDVDAVRPLLDVMGGRVVHCGGNGAGGAAKICNNMLLGISMIAASEAFVLGESLGLSHDALYEVISTASGQCWSVTTNCPVPGPVPTSPANRDYEPGFAGALMAKDLGLALEAIEQGGVAADLGPRATALYREFAASGGAGVDFSGIINTIRDASQAPGGSTENGARRRTEQGENP